MKGSGVSPFQQALYDDIAEDVPEAVEMMEVKGKIMAFYTKGGAGNVPARPGPPHGPSYAAGLIPYGLSIGNSPATGLLPGNDLAKLNSDPSLANGSSWRPEPSGVSKPLGGPDSELDGKSLPSSPPTAYLCSSEGLPIEP